MSHYDFFQNRECEYFPCHEGADPENFNCLFCFCPLYALGDKCGGNFTYTEQGIKDCAGCLFPHRRANYEQICKKLEDVMELVKKPPEKP
jgi:Zn-finger protein